MYEMTVKTADDTRTYHASTYRALVELYIQVPVYESFEMVITQAGRVFGPVEYDEFDEDWMLAWRTASLADQTRRSG